MDNKRKAMKRNGDCSDLEYYVTPPGSSNSSNTDSGPDIAQTKNTDEGNRVVASPKSTAKSDGELEDCNNDISFHHPAALICSSGSLTSLGSGSDLPPVSSDLNTIVIDLTSDSEDEDKKILKMFPRPVPLLLPLRRPPRAISKLKRPKTDANIQLDLTVATALKPQPSAVAPRNSFLPEVKTTKYSTAAAATATLNKNNYVTSTPVPSVNFVNAHNSTGYSYYSWSESCQSSTNTGSDFSQYQNLNGNYFGQWPWEENMEYNSWSDIIPLPPDFSSPSFDFSYYPRSRYAVPGKPSTLITINTNADATSSAPTWTPLSTVDSVSASMSVPVPTPNPSLSVSASAGDQSGIQEKNEGEDSETMLTGVDVEDQQGRNINQPGSSCPAAVVRTASSTSSSLGDSIAVTGPETLINTSTSDLVSSSITSITAEGAKKPCTNGTITVHIAVVHEEEDQKDGDEYNSGDKTSSGDDSGDATSSGDDSDDDSNESVDKDNHNDQPMILSENDEDDHDSHYNMGPKRKTKTLQVFTFKRKLNAHLKKCHQMNEEIGAKYSRRAVTELAKFICKSGVGHGLDYRHFYGPFEKKYPALVTLFTIYCKRQQNETRVKDLKSSYFRTAVKNHLSKKRGSLKSKACQKKLKAGVLSQSAVKLVMKSVPVRGNEPCEAAKVDFNSGLSLEKLEWIQNFSQRTVIFNKIGFSSSLFSPTGALMDFERIEMELQLLIGLKNYKIFKKNASTLLTQCTKLERKSSSFEAIKNLVGRFETKITKQDTIWIKEADNVNDVEGAVVSVLPTMLILKSLELPEGFAASVYVNNVNIKGIHNFTEAIITLIGLFRIVNVPFPFSSNQLLKFLADYVFGGLDVIKVFRKSGIEENLSSFRKAYYIKLITK